jgi:hypothetical protein
MNRKSVNTNNTSGAISHRMGYRGRPVGPKECERLSPRASGPLRPRRLCADVRLVHAPSTGVWGINADAATEPIA